MRKEKRQLKKEIKNVLKEIKKDGLAWWLYVDYVDYLKEQATEHNLTEELKQLETL